MDFMKEYNYSSQSIDLLDRLGRLTDGGDATRYTLYSFLQILNQNFLYNAYQPKTPNDMGLFKIWYEYLKKNNVDIYTNSNINKIITESNKIQKIMIGSTELEGKNFIFAIPPVSINELLQSMNLDNTFGNNFTQFSENTNYLTYIPVTFHWSQKLKLKKIWGFPRTSWGISHIVLTDYMDMKQSESMTVISANISRYDKSEFLNKTPNEISDKNILMSEVFRQLKTIYSNIPNPDNMIMSQNIYINNKWEPIHTAFMTTTYGYIDFKSPVYTNMYNCGAHNGMSSYSFTSIETAIVNAIMLTHTLIPETKKEYVISEAITIRYILIIILFIFLYFIFQT